YKPLELGPEVDENGVKRKISPVQRVRAKLSKGYFGEKNQIAKPTAEEYKEITDGHGHH
nr:ubiquinol-cytochrome c reductase cytochrome b subunit [Streptomyces sp. DSM 41633]